MCQETADQPVWHKAKAYLSVAEWQMGRPLSVACLQHSLMFVKIWLLIEMDVVLAGSRPKRDMHAMLPVIEFRAVIKVNICLAIYIYTRWLDIAHTFWWTLSLK